MDGINWKSYKGGCGGEESETEEHGIMGVVLQGNKDRDSVQENKLLGVVVARFIRIRPLQWVGHMSMQAGVTTLAKDYKGSA